jgi:hypothetical protein
MNTLKEADEMICKQYLHKHEQDKIVFSVNQSTGELSIESKKDKIIISNNNALYLISEIQNDLLDYVNIKKGKSRFNILNFILQKI